MCNCCHCDCEDYYQEPEPVQPPGLPGWVVARIIKLLEPEYGPWHEYAEPIKSKSGLFEYHGRCREVFIGGKQDGIQFQLNPIPGQPMFINPLR